MTYHVLKARTLINAMLLSTKEIGWDSQQQLIVDRRVYHDIVILRLIAYVMSPANTTHSSERGLIPPFIFDPPLLDIPPLKKISSSPPLFNKNFRRGLSSLIYTKSH